MAFAKKFIITSVHDPARFRAVYLINLLFCSVCFWDIAGVVVNVLLFFWSLPLLIHLFLSKKGYRRIKHVALLAVFLAVGLFTAFLHAGSHLGVNFVMLYHAAVCFFLFYGVHAEPNREKTRAGMERILSAIAFLATSLAGIGLLIVALAPSGRLNLCGYLLGIMDNRFTGVYTNPNLAAFASVVGMICCHILIRRRKNRGSLKKAVPLWFIIPCFALNSISLFLSDSNSSLILAAAYLCLYLACRFYQANGGAVTAKTVLRAVALAVCFVLIAASSLALRTLCQTAASDFINAADQLREGEQLVSFADYWNNWMNASKASGSEAGASTEIGRTQEYELSSGRLDSLKKSMVLFQRFPLLGVGKGNILDYGEKYLSDGFAFHDLHNGYLTILISDGLVGLILFLAFLLSAAKRLLRFLRRNRNGVPKEFSALVSVLAAYSLFGLFEKAVLFDITFMVVIFWAILGYAMSFLPAGQEQGAASISRPVFRLSSPYQSRYLCAVPVPTRMERVLIDIKETERPAVLPPKMIQYQQGHPSPQYRGTEQKACSLRAASSSFPN